MKHGFLIAFAASLVIVTAAGRAVPQTTVEGQAEPKPGQSTVRGVVTYSDTGRPLRHAGLVLLRNDGGKEQWVSVTNRRGEFVIESVSAGRYILFVDAPGILKPQGFQRNQNALIAQLRLNEKRDLFTEVVVNGTDSVNVKVQAVRGGVITGRVVTEDDQPVPNADVKLLKNENGKWLPVASTWVANGDRKGIKTDASGEYRIPGLTAGEYAVRVSEPIVASDKNTMDDDAYIDGALMVTFYPSAHGLDEAQPVTVVEGSEATGIDIRLPERTPHTMSGKAIGPDNRPGALVQVWIERVDESGLTNGAFGGNTMADNDGSWRVQGIPAGDYVVTIGGAILIETPDSPGHATIAPKRINVRVANEDVVIPDTRLSWGARIQGKLTLDGKPPDRPYQLLPLLIPAEDQSRKRDKSWQTLAKGRFASGGDYVGENGQFSMLAVPSGKYWLEVTTHTWRAFYLKSVTRKGVDLMQTPIKVTDDTVFGDVVVALATDFATVEGEITRPDVSAKQSLRDVVVVLAPATDPTRRVGGRFITSQADPQGKFTFTTPPGEYFVAALTPAQIKKITAPIDDDYFKKENQKFTRIKVRGAEKLKGVTVSLAEN